MGTVNDVDADSIISGPSLNLRKVQTDNNNSTTDDLRKVKVDFKKASFPIQEEAEESKSQSDINN
jgi:hypothetical protein